MWDPWIGPGYKDRRLLLLGESCYSWVDKSTGELCHPDIDHPISLARFLSPYLSR